METDVWGEQTIEKKMKVPSIKARHRASQLQVFLIGLTYRILKDQDIVSSVLPSINFVCTGVYPY